jgi:hypothetical protein
MPAVPIEVTRHQASLTDSDQATAETVEVMADQVEIASPDPLLRTGAKDAVSRFRGGPLYWALGIDPLRNPGAIAESIFWAVKHVLRFEHHEDQIRVWFNERDQLQLLIAPDLLLRLTRPKGDCAIYTTLICAMLRAWSIPYEFVTVAADPFEPDLFGHVYCRAVMPDGSRLTLDASHGKYPGWEVPKEHILRKAIWSESAELIPDEGSRFRGLHAYFERRPGFVRGARPGFGRLGRRGLGQGDTTTLNYPGMPDTSTTTLNYPGMPSGPPTGPVPITPSTGPGSGTNWAGFIQTLTGQGLNLVGKIVAPTTTIQSGPGGTFIQTPAGTPLPSGAVSPFGVASAGGSWLLIGGALVVIFLIAGAAKK